MSGKLTFTTNAPGAGVPNNGNHQLKVSSSGDAGIASSLATTTSASVQKATAASYTSTGSATVGFSINGGQKILVSFAAGYQLGQKRPKLARCHHCQYGTASRGVDR